MNLLYILNFINKIYEHELFPKVLGIAIATLILLFIIIFFKTGYFLKSIH